MEIPVVRRYFEWLQAGNPVGGAEAGPEVGDGFRSSMPGVFIIGDLTGVPLLKMAVESGKKVVEEILRDLPEAERKGGRSPREGPAADPGLDLGDGETPWPVLILGAGPAGLACAIECQKRGLDYLVLEGREPLATLHDFPLGKPILAKPDERAADPDLPLRDGTRESLLEDLKAGLAKWKPRIRSGVKVRSVMSKGRLLEVSTDAGTAAARRVVVALGKSGEARTLNIPGEESDQVHHRLFDPAEYRGQEVLVVGGGDSALEASAALAEAGSRVFHVHRGRDFVRAKEENVARFRRLENEKGIETALSTRPVGIEEGAVLLERESGEGKTVFRRRADQVFALLGRHPPLDFFRKSGIRVEGDKDFSFWVFLTAMVSFFTMLYFGKAGFAVDVEGLRGYLLAPFSAPLSFSLQGRAWYPSLAFLLGWAGSVVFLLSGALSFFLLLKRRRHYFGSPWNAFKYGYLTVAAIGFTGVYFHYCLSQKAGWTEGPTYWYSLLYSLTLAVFGFRRMAVKKTRYIRIQMSVLIAVQVFFLFLLPFHLFEPLLARHFPPDGFVMREMFPHGKWSSFGFVLFWPLNMGDFGASRFWTFFPLFQTFGLLYFLVRKWGKGAYCGWICSCGGMAESLGDEYRHLAPHGEKAKRWDNLGQGILAAALLVTALGFFFPAPGKGIALFGVTPITEGGMPLFAGTVYGLYKILIDVFFAGVLGLGVYFFLGGRIWCRYGCPLAALMHVYNRFSVYRIFAEKKKCISCNICTKVCHMGIDVMGYAQRGIPLNDVQCVRCSACVKGCPTEVLGFGSLKKMDLANEGRLPVPPDHPKEDWRAGIR